MKIPILSIILVLGLGGCATLDDHSAKPYEVIDATGRYESKIDDLLNEATARVNRARAEHGKRPIRFKGERIMVTEPRTDTVRMSDIGPEDDPTIAGAYYDRATKTAYIIPWVQRPSRLAMVHELAHAVLLSNRINNHPAIYRDEFMNWSN